MIVLFSRTTRSGVRTIVIVRGEPGFEGPKQGARRRAAAAGEELPATAAAVRGVRAADSLQGAGEGLCGVCGKSCDVFRHV